MAKRKRCYPRNSSRSTTRSSSTCRFGDLAVHEPDHKRLIAFLKAMEFSSLTRRVAEFSSIDVAEIEPDAKLAVGAAKASPLPLEREDEAESAPGVGKSAGPSKPAPRARRERQADADRRSPPRGSTSRTVKNSTVPNMKPCAASTGSRPGSSAPATRVLSPSTPRPPVSIRCRRRCAVSRWRWRRTRPATCRCRTDRAATAPAACSRARSRPIKSPSARRSTLLSRSSRTRACSRSARIRSSTFRFLPCAASRSGPTTTRC